MSNKIYSAFETPISFLSGTGVGVVGFSPYGCLNGSGWISQPLDLGPSSHSTLFKWRAQTQTDTNPTQGNIVEMYWATFDSVVSGVPQMVDANLPSGDQMYALQDAQKRNLQFIGGITADRAASGVPFVTSGLAQLYGRYGMLVWQNNLVVALASANTASGVHQLILTPVPDEIQ